MLRIPLNHNGAHFFGTYVIELWRSARALLLTRPAFGSLLDDYLQVVRQKPLHLISVGASETPQYSIGVVAKLSMMAIFQTQLCKYLSKLKLVLAIEYHIILGPGPKYKLIVKLFKTLTLFTLSIANFFYETFPYFAGWARFPLLISGTVQVCSQIWWHSSKSVAETYNGMRNQRIVRIVFSHAFLHCHWTRLLRLFGVE